MSQYFRNLYSVSSLVSTLVLWVVADSAVAATIELADYTKSTSASGVIATAPSDAGSAATSFIVDCSIPFDCSLPYSHVVVVQTAVDAIDAPTAVSENSFFSFGAASATGTLNLSSLSFDSYKGGPSDPRGWILRSSIDGFVADIDMGVVTCNPTGSGTCTSADMFSVDLSAPTYQGLASIDFRMYAYSPSNFAVNYGDLKLYGMNEVPIPAAAWLFGSALLGLAGVARSKRA